MGLGWVTQRRGEGHCRDVRTMWAEGLQGEGGELQAVCPGRNGSYVDPSPGGTQGWHLLNLQKALVPGSLFTPSLQSLAFSSALRRP